MGEAGHARVTQHFGVSRLLQGTLKAYRRVAEMNASTSALKSPDQPRGSA